MPGVEPGNVPSLSQDQLGGGLLDSLTYLFLGDLHHTSEVLAVESGGDEHLQSGLEQVVDELLVLGDDGVLVDLDVVLLFQGGQVLGDDLVVPVLDLDLLSLYEPLVDVRDSQGPCCCHLNHSFSVSTRFTRSAAVSEYPSAPILSHHA